MITSVYSKSSNSLGFNPILQKLYEMICEITFSKTVCGIFLTFCRSSFINNFIAKNKFLKPWNHWNLNISRPIHFKKILHTVLKIISVQISWKEFFFEKAFQGLRAFFALQNFWFWSQFFPQKISFIAFFKCDYLSSI